MNFKYHLLNIAAVLIFSYTTAVTITGTVGATVLKPEKGNKMSSRSSGRAKSIVKKSRKPFEAYEKTIFEDAQFFPNPAAGGPNVSSSPEVINADLNELNLIGTITGPSSIARAFIRKGARRRVSRRGRKGSSAPPVEQVKEIFRLWEDVYGYKLVSIRMDSVVLKGASGREVLKIYDGKKKEKSGKAKGKSTAGGTLKKNISRAEIKQQLKNNMENMLKGIVISPYRKNGKIVGFRLKKVRPYNFFYKIGARSGDIIMRVNDKKMDSSQKLYGFWQNFSKESKVAIDVERRGRMMRFDFSISD